VRGPNIAPETIASSLPANGSWVTSYGCGATNNDPPDTPNTSIKYTKQWQVFHPATLGGISSLSLDATPDWLDNSTVPPTLVPPSKVSPQWLPAYNLEIGDSGVGILAEGDSGGPVMYDDEQGNPRIWAVNSALDITGATGADAFGAVVYLHDWICAKQRAQQPHSWCVPGAPMIAPVQGCADTTMYTDQVVSYVCGQTEKCCDLSGSWDLACVQQGAQYLNSIQGSPDVCGFNAWTQGPVVVPAGQGTDVYPHDFNLFTSGDATVTADDVQGPIAVGGTFTATGSFYLNTLSGKPIGLVTSGTVNFSGGGEIVGDIFSPNLKPLPWASTTQTLATAGSGSVSLEDGGSYAFLNGPPPTLPFASAMVNLQNMSNALGAYVNSPLPTQYTVGTPWAPCKPCAPDMKPISTSWFDGYSTLWIASDQPQVNVTSITSAELAKSSTINIYIPVGSTLIINVQGGIAGSGSDPYPSFQNLGIFTKTGAPGYFLHNILWNFPEARQLSIGSCGVIGSVLAPYAAVKFNQGGAMEGTLVASSVSPYTPTGGYLQFDYAPFYWPPWQQY